MSERTPGETYDRFEWLANRRETALDPEIEIVDSHHHLWDLPTSRYLAEELLVDITASHNVTRTVFVECRFGYDEGPPHLRPVGETRSVAHEADRLAELGAARIGAIVGFADLSLRSAVGEVLDAHIDAGNGLFRGVRHGTNLSDDPAARRGHQQPTPNMMLEASFAAGVRELARRGLSFDAWMYHDQLHELVSLARSVPDCSIVLNHMGGPLNVGRYAANQAESWSVWYASMVAIATCPNVVVKVGGLGMDHQFGMGWSDGAAPPSSTEVAAHWRPWVEATIETFGPERVMFESNFPIDRQCLTYPVVWNALQRLSTDYDDSERAAMFSGTAARIYRLETDVEREVATQR